MLYNCRARDGAIHTWGSVTSCDVTATGRNSRKLGTLASSIVRVVVAMPVSGFSGPMMASERRDRERRREMVPEVRPGHEPGTLLGYAKNANAPGRDEWGVPKDMSSQIELRQSVVRKWWRICSRRRGGESWSGRDAASSIYLEGERGAKRKVRK